MPAAEVINRIIRTARDLGAPGRDPVYGYGMVNPTAALTREVPSVAANPLDTTPDPGIARFGSAPASGQAQSAPDETVAGGPVDARAPGINAGAVAPMAEPRAAPPNRGWWAAAGLLLLSAVVGLFTIRRFAALAHG
jgi:serine protease